MARKPNKEKVPRSEIVYIRMSAEEKELLSVAAARLDMTLSDYVRFLVLPVASGVSFGGSAARFRENLNSVLSGTADYFQARYQYKPVGFETYTFQTPDEEPEEVAFQLHEIAKQVTDELSERLVEIEEVENENES